MGNKDFLGRTRDERVEEDSARARHASEESHADLANIRRGLTNANWMLIIILILVIVLLVKVW